MLSKLIHVYIDPCVRAETFTPFFIEWTIITCNAGKNTLNKCAFNKYTNATIRFTKI